MGEETSAGATLRRLHEVKEAVEAAELTAEIHRSTHEEPYLRVTNPRIPRLTEGIHCAPHTTDGHDLWLFWSWGEAICPAGETHQAAKEIGHVLGDRM